MSSTGLTIFDALLKGTFKSELKYEFWPAVDHTSKKLLIILHGRGDTLEGFHFLPAALGLDVLNILFLEAPDVYGAGYSWYDLPPHQGTGIVRSRHMIFKLLENLESELSLRCENIFLFGFSQGCLMCLDVGLRYPKFLNGIVGISGYVFFEEEYPHAFSPVARDQHFFVSHGFQDEALSFTKSQASIERLKTLGIAIDWTPLHKSHTVDEVEEIPMIRDFLIKLIDTN